MLLTTEPELHRAEPKTLRYRLLHTAARITRGQRKVSCASPSTGPGHWRWPERSPACGRSRSRPDSQHHRQLAPPHHEHGDTGPSAGDRRCLDDAVSATKII